MTMTDRQKKIWGIAAIIALVVFTGLLCWFVGRPMIRFVSEPDEFREWVDSHGIWGRVAFIGMVIFQIIVAIIPGEPLGRGPIAQSCFRSLYARWPSKGMSFNSSLETADSAPLGLKRNSVR